MSASSGFGNRRPAERKAYGSPDDTAVSRGQRPKLDIADVPTPPAPRQMSGVLFGLAILACIGGGYLAATKGVPRSLEQYWREGVGSGVEDASRRTANADIPLDRVHNNCKSRSDFVGFEPSKSRASNDPNIFHAGEAALNTAATYLSCLTGEQPERFCQWRHRTHLVSALKDYYRLMARVREERIMMTGGPMAAARNSLVGSVGREGSSVQTDQRVVHGLRALLVEGYLSRDDLSQVLHPLTDLEAALHGAEPKYKGCS